jgi:hypothetical protein
LKQTDFDGEFKNSAIIAIEKCEEDIIELAIYPNPTSGKVTIDYQLLDDEMGVFEIWDITGKKVLSFNLLPHTTSRSLWGTEVLNSGVYHYKMIVNELIVQKNKLVIVKD